MGQHEKDGSAKNVLYPLALLIFIFLVYFWFSSDVELFSVQVFDEDAKVVHNQKISLAIGTNLIQNMLSAGRIDEFVMQSSVPLDKEKKSVGFKALLTAPSGGTFFLDNVTYYRNGEQINFESFDNVELQADSVFVFESEPVVLEAKESQKNEIRLTFSFSEKDTGKVLTDDYVYEYLRVTRCETNSDCPQLAPVCDVSNAARYSKESGVHYCVRPCGAHKDCAVGQICIMGACGY